MAGALTTIEILSRKLLRRWVPKWHESFYDPELGCFYERLGRGFKPILTGQRRLLTQCRQLSMYSHAFWPGLEKHFEFIVDHYHVPETGTWLFSLDDEGQPKDATSDLYALAFVIFSFSHYFRATGDDRATALARRTLDFIDGNFRATGSAGFVEALDEKGVPLDKVRRHESHMHLLEACLFAAEVWDDPAYRTMGDELVMLFRERFYDTQDNILSEYFTDDLQPLPEDGKIVCEPGHYCEWIWLLKKHARQGGEPGRYDDLCRSLLGWANQYGWDAEYGGIYDELTPDGRIVQDTKRLWPFAESLKANALMLDSGMDKDELKANVTRMVDVFKAHYMEERGFWTEWLTRDLTPDTDYMPGTTPYHVYFGIMEAREVLRTRGGSKSWVAGPQLFLYGLRRGLSDRVKVIRNQLRSNS